MPERFKVTKAEEAAKADKELGVKDEESATGHLLDEKKGEFYYFSLNSLIIN